MLHPFAAPDGEASGHFGAGQETRDSGQAGMVMDAFDFLPAGHRRIAESRIAVPAGAGDGAGEAS